MIKMIVVLIVLLIVLCGKAANGKTSGISSEA